jgi:hypothetical protein
VTDRFSAALDETLAYLDSPAARESVRADPYWPKWDSPWWRMTLLHELGLASHIPRSITAAMLEALRGHYLPDFPIRLEDVPAGRDPYRHIVCHCAVGTMVQVLDAWGVDVHAELPWMQAWLRRYQLGDGGLNCDERAYARPDGKSSIVSTLPPLEAMLRTAREPLGDADARFLDAGAAYLIAHRLVRRAGGDRGVIDPRWLEPCFPRFYDYDALRGLAFLARWAERRARPLPGDAVSEVVERLVTDRARQGGLQIGRRASFGSNLRRDASGAWVAADRAASFPLLDAVSEPGRVSPELTAGLDDTTRRLESLRARGLLSEPQPG